MRQSELGNSISRSSYYAQMRELAQQKRAYYSLTTHEITLKRVREIYHEEKIVIDPCKQKLRKLKAAYFNDADGCSVFLNMKLPEEPRLFAMVHELKHHYVDQDQLKLFCQDVDDDSPMIEIGAEVFAAEFLFPDQELRRYILSQIQGCNVTAEDVVRLKYHSPARVSYQFFQKSLQRLGYIRPNQFKEVKFAKLHEQLYGKSYYHRRLK